VVAVDFVAELTCRICLPTAGLEQKDMLIAILTDHHLNDASVLCVYQLICS